MAYVKDQWTRAVKQADGTAGRFGLRSGGGGSGGWRGFMMRLYTHMLPSSHERAARKAVDSRPPLLFSMEAHGAVTELAVGRFPHGPVGTRRRPVAR
jgi:hypothetical protein